QRRQPVGAGRAELHVDPGNRAARRAGGGEGVMKEPTDVGQNRTGVKRYPADARRTAEGARAGVAEITEGRGPAELELARLSFSRDADPVGTMPPPVGVKGMAKAALATFKGHAPTVLLDQIGARLAFERTGTRLYEALLVKHAAAHLHDGAPTREELEIIRDDELQHFWMLELA